MHVCICVCVCACFERAREMEGHSRRCKSKPMAEDDAVHFSKKRKLYCELEEEYCGAGGELAENDASPSPAAAWTCGGDIEGVGKKRLRSPDVELSQNVDLQLHEGSGAEISSSANGFLRESAPTSMCCGDPEQAIATADSAPARPKKPPPVSPRRKIPSSAAKTPTEAELDEFFAAAETHEQKRFAEKYNYDIVKDVPLEGRYHWICLHP